MAETSLAASPAQSMPNDPNFHIPSQAQILAYKVAGLSNQQIEELIVY